GRWFHVMRDWWTHTDLVLAGMWGGVAGVLPDLQALLSTYKAGAMETPNVDQWFLRDAVWPYLRTNVMVHDRIFTPAGAQPWPGPAARGDRHVGQNDYALPEAERAATLLRCNKPGGTAAKPGAQ